MLGELRIAKIFWDLRLFPSNQNLEHYKTCIRSVLGLKLLLCFCLRLLVEAASALINTWTVSLKNHLECEVLVISLQFLQNF
jgi:hypothetical protein